LEYEECPRILVTENSYTFGGNKIELKNLKYKSTYNTYKFLFNEEEWKIISFHRYRDGGTTDIVVEDLNGNTHQFHQDTPFKMDGECYLMLNGVKINLVE
jgi:hypothetical protein